MSDLSGAKALYISPDRTLSAVLFDELLDGQGRMLFETFRIHIVPNARRFIVPHGPIPAKRFVAFGGIEFGTTSAATSSDSLATYRHLFAEETFEPLRGGEAEVEAIGALYRRLRPEDSAILYKGREATETNLRAMGEPPRVLYISTKSFPDYR